MIRSHATLLVKTPTRRFWSDCTYLAGPHMIVHTFGGASHDEIARKTFRQNTSRGGGGTTCLLAWELPVAIGLLFVILSCVTYLHHISMVFWLWDVCVNQSLIDTHEKKMGGIYYLLLMASGVAQSKFQLHTPRHL